MGDLRFYNAWLTPSATVILGKKLKPFCLKYRIFLEGISSPYLNSDKEITPIDLIIALKICSDEDIGKLSCRDYILSLILSWSKKRLIKSSIEFVKYLSTHDAYPKYWDDSKKNSGGVSSIPFQLSVIATLCKNGITYNDALVMPEAKAIWLATTFSIQGGSKIEILTTDDEALLDELAKVRAKTNE